MWSADRGANIALIKYMGKKDEGINLPTNSSISWTLKHLRTKVLIEPNKGASDMWLPIKTPYPFQMSAEGKKKYITHFQRIKKHFGVDGHFTISSGNNFPADCGIASSASSFAALTEAACLAFTEMTGKNIDTVDKARLSSQGSGSSCRSFYDGWVMWEDDKIKSVETKIDNINHMVVIVGDGRKKVSSSQAHKKVKTSSLFPGRIERAEAKSLYQPLKKGLGKSFFKFLGKSSGICMFFLKPVHPLLVISFQGHFMF
ncbi:MAG: diphosphomevalonate decarboxylase [Bdellovibrionales bacterium]|nr:hypothetical protein [Bdellovibrionales bacterium]NQZ19495.1 diphosphomevalonate decarboxylase [Bdellovibrionales bacterium]